MSKRIVAKFGGSSLSDAQQFKKVKAIIESNEQRQIIVPSAPGKSRKEQHKVTDLLLMCHQLASHHLTIKEIFEVVERRFLAIQEALAIDFDLATELKVIEDNIMDGASVDYVVSRGEYLNAKLLAAYLDFEFLDAVDVIFLAKGKPDMTASMKALKEQVKEGQSVVIPGFYGCNELGELQTFARGGSDITGSIVAAGLEASLYENWTDVSGFLMIDPNIYPSKSMQAITYSELRELSYMGASVLHEESVIPVRNQHIRIHIKNTNEPHEPGTLIIPDTEAISNATITGIAGKQNFTSVRIEKTYMSEDLSFYRKLISVFETNDLKIEHMPTSIDTITIIVPTDLFETKKNKIIEEIKIYCNPDNIVISSGLAIIAVVGRGMISNKGTSAKIFTALAQRHINIRMISQGSGELTIIVGVANEDFNDTIQAIYQAFETEGMD